MIGYCVVIPAHNAEKFIGASLASVARQTCRPSEVVVVVDGSHDNTAGVARAAGARVIEQSPTRGPSASRNVGVADTRAPVVAFLDADDEWLPDHAERLLRALEASGAAFAGSNAERFGTESGVMTSALTGGEPLDLRDLLIADNPVIQSSVMIERNAFERAGGYDESMRLSEDYDLWTRVVEHGTFAFVNQPTVRRRMHDAQATTRFRADLVRAWWGVRRRTVSRRLAGAPVSERDRVLCLLTEASQADIAWAIWTGDSAMLTMVREELHETDSMLGLGDRLGALGGAGNPGRRLRQDLRCASRSLLQLVRGER
jgi:glycosyltransferase involved in cell wall biosynthesis